MSHAADRAAIAAALSEVEGVTGYEYPPNPPKTGDAWPMWSGSDRDQGRAFLNTWRAVVVLPEEDRMASVWVDEHHDALVDAIEDNDVAFVDRLEPGVVKTSAGDLLALQIVMRSE